MFPTSKNYYEVLGVKSDASADDIKRSFFAKIRSYHPDKSASNENAQQEIEDYSRVLIEAWKVLSNKNFREEYDCQLKGIQKNDGNSTFNQMKYTNKINMNNLTFQDDHFCVDCEQCGDTLKLTPEVLEQYNVFECITCCFRIEI